MPRIDGDLSIGTAVISKGADRCRRLLSSDLERI